MPEREWKRAAGRITLAEVAELGERYLKGHQKGHRDFGRFFDHYGGLLPVEREAVQAYVAARIGRVPSTLSRNGR